MTAAEHAATVREAMRLLDSMVESREVSDSHSRSILSAGRASLVWLEEQAARAEAAEAEVERCKDWTYSLNEERLAAEARVDSIVADQEYAAQSAIRARVTAEKERDELKRLCDKADEDFHRAHDARVAAEKERDKALRVRFQANQMIVVPEDALIRESLRANAAEVLVAQLEADLAHETNALTESTRRVAQLETALREAIRIDATGHLTGECSSWVPAAHAVLAADRETT